MQAKPYANKSFKTPFKVPFKHDSVPDALSKEEDDENDENDGNDGNVIDLTENEHEMDTVMEAEDENEIPDDVASVQLEEEEPLESTYMSKYANGDKEMDIDIDDEDDEEVTLDLKKLSKPGNKGKMREDDGQSAELELCLW